MVSPVRIVVMPPKVEVRQVSSRPRHQRPHSPAETMRYWRFHTIKPMRILHRCCFPFFPISKPHARASSLQKPNPHHHVHPHFALTTVPSSHIPPRLAIPNLLANPFPLNHRFRTFIPSIPAIVSPPTPIHTSVSQPH